jgi:hypothetical protein
LTWLEDHEDYENRPQANLVTLENPHRDIPRWMAFLGYAQALLLLLRSGHLYRDPLVFPLGMLVISMYAFLANLRPKVGAGSQSPVLEDAS